MNEDDWTKDYSVERDHKSYNPVNPIRVDLSLVVVDRYIKAGREAVEGGDYERALSAIISAEKALERGKMAAAACLDDPEIAHAPDSPPLETLAAARLLDTLNSVWLEVNAARHRDDPLSQVVNAIIEQKVQEGKDVA